MKHKKYGFTLIELVLFLAITGILFIGIIAGTQNSIRSQKYNDSVQNFVNFWKDIYAEVANVQNPNEDNSGRSEQAIYGKLVVFGEERGLDGNPIDRDQMIFSYDVVASATGTGTGTGTEVLKNMQANVLTITDNKAYVSGIAKSYTPTWGATIQNTEQSGNGTLFKGSILVIRHPRSGIINTFISNEILAVNDFFTNGASINENTIKNFLTSKLDSFATGQINFCINSEDIRLNIGRRKNVRLIANARNASGIEILSFDNQENPCTH